MFRRLLIVISILLLCILIFVFPIYLNGKDQKHMTGRDTVEVYGNGNFQIIGKSPAHLADLERNATLEESINKYKLIGDNLYVYGKRGYTVVNIKSEIIRQYVVYLENNNWDRINMPKYGEQYIRLKRLEDFSQEEQRVFDNM